MERVDAIAIGSFHLKRLRHANLSTTQISLGKVPDTEAMEWIENLDSQPNQLRVKTEKVFIPSTSYGNISKTPAQGISRKKYQISPSRSGFFDTSKKIK